MADGTFLSVRTLAGQRHSVALPQDPSATIADLKALLGRECSETLRHCRLLHNVRAPRVKTCCCMPTRSRLKVSIGPVVVGAGLLSGGLEDGGLLGAAPGAVPGGSLPCLGRRGVAGSSPPPALLLSFPRCRWPWKPRRALMRKDVWWFESSCCHSLAKVVGRRAADSEPGCVALLPDVARALLAHARC